MDCRMYQGVSELAEENARLFDFGSASIDYLIDSDHHVMIRVHDLKHTFGRRLRAAGVPNETRKVLSGHRNGDITSHYSAPQLEELIEASNRVCDGKSGKTPALVMFK